MSANENEIPTPEYHPFKQQELLESLNPTTALLKLMAIRIIALAWRLQRLNDCENDILCKTNPVGPVSPLAKNPPPPMILCKTNPPPP